MTFSLVALSHDRRHLGVVTASRSLAVGAAVPAVAPGVGAVATQAWTNKGFRARGLDLLRAGLAPQDLFGALAPEDAGFDWRQLAVVDVHGRSATWTGPRCSDWAGDARGPGYAAVGNLLAGPRVVQEMEATFLAGREERFARLLVEVLAAGDAAGGDARGRQSAALYVVAAAAADTAPPLTEVDLRVDDHPDPVGQLGRLLGLHENQSARGRTAALR